MTPPKKKEPFAIVRFCRLSVAEPTVNTPTTLLPLTVIFVPEPSMVSPARSVMSGNVESSVIVPLAQ